MNPNECQAPINLDNDNQKRSTVHMAAPTTSARELKIHEGGDWTTKTVVCNTIGELRVELNIPDGVQINISDTLYTDNTAPMPENQTNDSGATIPLFVGWQSNNKTGGSDRGLISSPLTRS